MRLSFKPPLSPEHTLLDHSVKSKRLLMLTESAQLCLHRPAAVTKFRCNANAGTIKLVTAIRRVISGCKTEQMALVSFSQYLGLFN